MEELPSGGSSKLTFSFRLLLRFLKGQSTSVTLIQRQLDVISRETQRIAVTCKLASGHSTQPTWHNTCNHDVLTNSNNCLLPPCRISWFSDNKKFVNWFTRFWDFLKNILICSLFSYKMRRGFWWYLEGKQFIIWRQVISKSSWFWTQKFLVKLPGNCSRLSPKKLKTHLPSSPTCCEAYQLCHFVIRLNCKTIC